MCLCLCLRRPACVALQSSSPETIASDSIMVVSAPSNSQTGGLVELLPSQITKASVDAANTMNPKVGSAAIFKSGNNLILVGT